MSREDILTASLRLFAVWLALVSVQQVINAYGWTSSGGQWANERWWMIAVALLPGLVAACLWFFPLTVVTRLLPRLREQHEPVSAGVDTLLDTGMILLGLWWLLRGIGGVAHSAAIIALGLHGNVSDHYIAELVSSVVTIVASVAVLLRGPGIVGAVRRFRESGYTPPRQSTPQKAEQDH